MRFEKVSWMIAAILIALPASAFADEPPRNIADIAVAAVTEVPIKVTNPLSMQVFENTETGSQATVSIEPDFHPGCRLKLTLRF